MGLISVASIISTSVGMPVDRAGSEKSNAKTPLSDQRRKRLKGLCVVHKWPGHPSSPAVAEDMDHATKHLALTHTTHTTSLEEEGLDSLKLVLSKSKQVGQHPSS
ncbi:MAG: hypothetical protein TH68_02475 [Candidatus Synechococcus spongiarum 142]|uniref:Uncharacterized protein n=1 Tax=Candidatus Synechococcus spongiarum 142 TaxID=1608213 RepID=A0A6N3X9G8_9SYNE|nr:MAG: hypothetical protein TH68_02475 [Candidatus Synechococcus spongiarum 142]